MTSVALVALAEIIGRFVWPVHARDVFLMSLVFFFVGASFGLFAGLVAGVTPPETINTMAESPACLVRSFGDLPLMDGSVPSSPGRSVLWRGRCLDPVETPIHRDRQSQNRLRSWRRKLTLITNTFTLGPTPNAVRSADGEVLTVPEGWALLPPGDAALTRRVKAAGGHWIVQEKVGRKMFFRGVWAPAATIERIRAELEAERSTEDFAKKRQANDRRREKEQAQYVDDFHGAVLSFLSFHPSHSDLADRLARAVTNHATPVGSGTVARTKRIPVGQRAEAAVIAWMRHQTTAYDSMTIPRIKGKRREVRRMLAQRSQELLGRYRNGEPVEDGCPLKKVLADG